MPPLDVPELLACLVRQSEPLLDQFGVRKGKCYLYLVHRLVCLHALCFIMSKGPFSGRSIYMSAVSVVLDN